MKNLIFGAAIIGLLSACSEAGDKTPAVEAPAAEAGKTDHNQIVTGNGEHNYITLDGAFRTGDQFTFPEVTLSKDGFLVFHPFRDGAPVQTEYVAAKALPAGSHIDVTIDVTDNPQTGDMYIVMLHYDMNRDGVFDFNDGVDVPDAPVFEGRTLVALRYETPESR